MVVNGNPQTLPKGEEVTSLSLIVPGVPSTLNAWSRKHWAVRNRERKEWAERVALVIRRDYYPERLRVGVRMDEGNPFAVTLHYFVKSKRAKNDLDNRVPKHILDALSGWAYVDDSQIVKLTQTITRGAERDETHIHVCSAKPGGDE